MYIISVALGRNEIIRLNIKNCEITNYIKLLVGVENSILK
jgi:hypothetical protein